MMDKLDNSTTLEKSKGIPNHLVLSTERYMPTWMSAPKTKPNDETATRPIWR
jgi:hypothetical protein